MMTNVKAINGGDGLVHRRVNQLWEGPFPVEYAPHNIGVFMKYNIGFKAVSVISDPSGSTVLV